MDKDLTAAQHGDLPEPSPEVVEAYLRANEEYWRRVDDEPMKIGKWRNGTVQEATAYALRTAIAAERAKSDALRTVMIAAAVPPTLEEAYAEGRKDEREELSKERDIAIAMLAAWCIAVDVNGTGWDDWDEHYKDAMYRPGPLRGLLDKAIADARAMHSAWRQD